MPETGNFNYYAVLSGDAKYVKANDGLRLAPKKKEAEAKKVKSSKESSSSKTESVGAAKEASA